MTTATASEYDQYQGKKVILTVSVPAEDGKEATTKEVEGKAEAANALGVMLKPKGKTGLELYEADQILDVAYAPEKEKELKAKMLKPVEHGNAKQHLVDRHGYRLAEINKMDETSAFEFHNGLDHVDLDLGHTHGVKEEAATSTEETPAAEE